MHSPNLARPASALAFALALSWAAALAAGCTAAVYHPCDTDRDCPSPQTCAGGICASSACGVGAPTCLDDAACSAAQHCAAGCCVAGLPGSCTRDADCSSRAAAPVCDTVQRTCVACVTARDCGPGRLCTGHACVGTPGCYSSSDCKDQAKPVCNVSARSCVGCLQGTDCLDPAKPICDATHACVPTPSCRTDAGCSPPDKRCAPGGQCVPCLVAADCVAGLVCSAQNQCVTPAATTCASDVECASNPNGTHCRAGSATSTGACVACLTDDQCPPGKGCAVDNTCQVKQCNVDADCTNPATPKCLTTASPRACVACLGDVDCPNGGTCSPAVHTCQAPAARCRADADCAADLAAPHCAIPGNGANNCVACRLPGQFGTLCGAGVACPNDCGPGQLCGAGNLCQIVSCRLDADCTDPTRPHCLPGAAGAAGSCVPCALTSQCGAGMKCAADHTCAPICTVATAAKDCAAPTPKCRESPSGNGCVQCLGASDCPAAAPVCSASSTCIPAPPAGCRTNADCPAAQHVCDASASPHACVQCLVNGDCSAGDVCDLPTRTCRPPPVGGEGQPCKTGDLCNAGLLCIDEDGASVCRTLCDATAAVDPCPAIAAGSVCEWLGFDASKSLFGVCEPKNGNGGLGAACTSTQIDSCEWNLLCVPTSASRGVCRALCKPGGSCASGGCNPILGALDPAGAQLSMAWCGPATAWGRSCITDSGSAGPDCGAPLSSAGAGALFCKPSPLPGEYPAEHVAGVCSFGPAVSTAQGGANDGCSALGGTGCRTGLCLGDGPATCFAGCQFSADCARDGGGYCFDVTLFSGTAKGAVASCEPTCRDDADCQASAACVPRPTHIGSSWQAVCAPLSGAGRAGARCTGAADCESGACLTASALFAIERGQTLTGFTPADGLCLGSCIPSLAGDCATAGTACRIDAALPLAPLDTGDQGVVGRPNPGVCWGGSCASDAACAGFSSATGTPRVCAPFKTTTMASVDTAKKCTKDADCAGSTSWQAVCNSAANNPNPGGAVAAGLFGPNGRCRAVGWALGCAPSLGAAKGGPGAACSADADCRTGHCVGPAAGTSGASHCFGACATSADCLGGTRCQTSTYLGLAATQCAP